MTSSAIAVPAEQFSRSAAKETGESCFTGTTTASSLSSMIIARVAFSSVVSLVAISKSTIEVSDDSAAPADFLHSIAWEM